MGILVANEINTQRAWELAENLERSGVRCACVVNETPARLVEHFGTFFDRVLIDAPCSGEGMFRKSETARRDWSPEFVNGCAIRQGEILRQAARLVRPGGILVYSTCTFNPSENENVIAQFLNERRDFELLQPVSREGFSPGKPDWLDVSITRPELMKAIRIWPHTTPGEGHFIALLQHITTSNSNKVSMNGFTPGRRKQIDSQRLIRQSASLSKPAHQQWENFCLSNLKPEIYQEWQKPDVLESLHISGSYLYQISPELLDLSGLRIIHPGWWLGSFKKERFEPSHALALGLHREDNLHAVNFSIDDTRSLAYLRGESLRLSGSDGWCLVCVDSFPIGWGKQIQGVLKNYLPKGLRWN